MNQQVSTIGHILIETQKTSLRNHWHTWLNERETFSNLNQQA
jgi:hypothetical protein